uniref:alpha/beta fold hydrolase n=1 Tax=uncultured Polaribacter sp. TaxID=174711 RepID=UPI002610AC1F|nr:alpha/beta hydrolase [uncultured Polaribacter sp.]
MTSKNWEKLGKYTKVFNRTIFMIDSENQSDPKKETLVILHGYPTSSYDYHKVFPQLAKKYRVILHDHLGFGFSEKPLDFSYSLIEQADIALQLWKQLGLKKVVLLAHDYGTSVCTEIIARHNKQQINLQIDKLILSNGSIHIEFSKLRTIQKLLKNKYTGKWVARLTNYPIFKRNMRNVYFDKTKVTDEELKEMWLQLEYNNGRNVIHLLTNYINERYYFWHRWVGAVKETSIKTTIIWAENDPIAIPKIAELLHKEISYSKIFWMKNCGHFLMLEQPKEWSSLVLKA